jgi:hypothetical protein
VITVGPLVNLVSTLAVSTDGRLLVGGTEESNDTYRGDGVPIGSRSALSLRPGGRSRAFSGRGCCPGMISAA